MDDEMNDDLDDEVWDEHRWEEELKRNDERVDRMMRLREVYSETNPPPHDKAPETVQKAWYWAMDDWINRQMGWDEFADEMKEYRESGEADEEPLSFSEHDPEFAAELDALAEEDDEDEPLGFDDWHDDPLYQETEKLADVVIDWSKRLPDSAGPEVYEGFYINALQIGAKVVNAHASLRYESLDSLGRRIAMLKRALGYANQALEDLQGLKGGPFVTDDEYQEMYLLTYEARNAVALAVQEARDRFERGGV